MRSRTGKEIVGRGSGKGVVHAPQRQAREQAERVEVARVIAHHDERLARRQVLAPHHVESIIGAQERSQRHLRGAAERANRHVGVAREAPHALGGGQLEIGGALDTQASMLGPFLVAFS